MRVKCYSVRLKSLIDYSEKAYKAEAFDGTKAFIPKSQVLANDNEVSKSDAYWISAWFLEKEDVHLTYSTKKEAWFDSDTARRLPTFTIEKHVPAKIEPKQSNDIDELKK